MKKPLLIFALLGLFAQASCVGYPTGVAAEAVGIYLTKDETPPPADQSQLILPHDSWCYATAGYPECYTTPQPGGGERLINVDPESSYPLTTNSYIRASTPKPTN